MFVKYILIYQQIYSFAVNHTKQNSITLESLKIKKLTKMSKLLFSLQAVLVLSLALFITSCGEDDPDPMPEPMTIADIVEDTERFS